MGMQCRSRDNAGDVLTHLTKKREVIQMKLEELQTKAPLQVMSWVLLLRMKRHLVAV